MLARVKSIMVISRALKLGFCNLKSKFPLPASTPSSSLYRFFCDSNISVQVVGEAVALFSVKKRRSKKSSRDIEKHGEVRQFTPLSSNKVSGLRKVKYVQFGVRGNLIFSSRDWWGI
ncbi:hypothetical protein MKX01_034706 [Papaver californicum]|nr:hypothetical protein MKX01_034706 [Papaver californicum]